MHFVSGLVNIFSGIPSLGLESSKRKRPRQGYCTVHFSPSIDISCIDISPPFALAA